MKAISKNPNIAAKRAAGAAGAALIQDGMIVGLGSGSTANCFIEALILRCRDGLKIIAVTSSIHSQQLAQKGGIKVIDLNEAGTIDLDIDGADEIDSKKRMIKGGGGALLREKIIAKASREMVVIVDDEKRVEKLGAFGLPLEAAIFGYKHTLMHIERLGYQGTLRTDDTGSPVKTDNGNYLIDLSLPQLCDDPETLEHQLKEVPGILETGFFLNLAGRVIVGFADGRAEIHA